MNRVICVPSAGASRRVLVKLRSGWNSTSHASPPRPVCSSTARGFGAKIETKPMPNFPILVRSPSLLDENSRVSWPSMIASFMPSPLSSTCTAIVPSSSASGRNSSHTSTEAEPASMLFWTSSR